MTTARPDTSWKTTPPCTDAQLQQWRRYAAWPTRFWCDVWGRWNQWCVFCTSSLAVYSTRCSPPDLNLVNLEATVAAKWTLAFIFSWKRHFDDVELTSSLRSVVKVMMADYNIVEHGENNFTTQIRYKIVSSNNVCQLKSAETDNFYTQ